MTKNEMLALDMNARSFEVVQPRGPGRDWKSPISTSISRGALDYLGREFGITVDTIKEAIVFYTATEASAVWAGDTLKIEAVGYRMGPAGDR